jgi:hypothetical protein
MEEIPDSLLSLLGIKKSDYTDNAEPDGSEEK